MNTFLAICSIAGLFLFATGLVHIAIWAYSFFKNIRFFIRQARLIKYYSGYTPHSRGYSDWYRWFFLWYPFKHACLFDTYNGWFKSHLIERLEQNESELEQSLRKSKISRGDYHDTK